MLPPTPVAADSSSAWSIREGSRKQQISCRQLGSTFFRALTTWANSGAALCRGRVGGDGGGREGGGRRGREEGGGRGREEEGGRGREEREEREGGGGREEREEREGGGRGGRGRR